MAIINCPECNTKVSDKAKQCPNCAYPFKDNFIKGIDENLGKVETELTSKKFKGRLILDALLIGISFSFGLSKNENMHKAGAILLVVGLVWLFIIKTQIWWHHK